METFDASIDRELRNQAKTKKRILILSFFAVLTIVARIFIHNPEPAKRAVHHNKPFRPLPGMLARLPASERAKLSPDMVAKLQEADRNKLLGLPASALARVPATAETNKIVSAEKFDYEKERYIFEKITRAPRKIEELTPKNTRKTMLVMFKHGRFITAEKAEKKNSDMEIVLSDKQLSARLPMTMITYVSNNALTWEEPIPTGFARLKPARGITIEVEKNIARRITVERS